MWFCPACATSKNVEEAFNLYREMKDAGLRADQKLYGALCQACATSLKVSGPHHRRSQLVLMERAFNVVEDMQEDHIQPDVIMWNILISCTAGAGQLQRSFEV